jgi:hypothetical protein
MWDTKWPGKQIKKMNKFRADKFETIAVRLITCKGCSDGNEKKARAANGWPKYRGEPEASCGRET